jgi:hypothetical protein
MSSSPQRQTADSGRTPVPPGALPLESILLTEELQKRRPRPPDYEKENRALVALARALADSPGTILQILTDTILELCSAGSAGISLLTLEDGGKRFYWPAISGVWRPHIGGGTPRDFGPCGDVLDRNTALLFQHVERRYTYFEPVTPPVEEALLVPFYVAGKAVGTIWAVAHDTRRKFDAEDERLLNSLGTFASSAYQVVTSLDALKSNVTEREQTEQALRQRTAEFERLAETLEAQVRARTGELDQRNNEVLKQSTHLRDLSYRMMQIQDNERRHIARELHDSAGQILAGLAIKLSSIVEQAKHSAPELAKEAGEGQELVRELSQEIRTTSPAASGRNRAFRSAALVHSGPERAQRAGYHAGNSGRLRQTLQRNGAGDIPHRAGVFDQRSPSLRQQAGDDSRFPYWTDRLHRSSRSGQGHCGRKAAGDSSARRGRGYSRNA